MSSPRRIFSLIAFASLSQISFMTTEDNPKDNSAVLTRMIKKVEERQEKLEKQKTELEQEKEKYLKTPTAKMFSAGIAVLTGRTIHQVFKEPINNNVHRSLSTKFPHAYKTLSVQLSHLKSRSFLSTTLPRLLPRTGILAIPGALPILALYAVAGVHFGLHHQHRKNCDNKIEKNVEEQKTLQKKIESLLRLLPNPKRNA